MSKIKSVSSIILIAMLLVLTPFNASFIAKAEETSSAQQNAQELKLKDASFLGQFEVEVEPKGTVANIEKIKINDVEQEAKSSKWLAFNGGYYLDKDNNKIIMNEPSDGASFTVVMKSGSIYNYEYKRNAKKGKRFELKTSENKGDDSSKPDTGNKDQETTNNDVNNLKVNDYSTFSDFMLNLEPKEAINQIKEIQFNRAVQEAKTSKWLAFNGGYYLDKEKSAIIMNEPRDGALISITLNSGKTYNYKYVRSNKVGQRMVEQTDETVNSTKTLKIRLVGSFEGAIQGQQKYDAVSGASMSASINKNSNVQVQAAEVESPDSVVPESAWKPLNKMQNLYVDRKQFNIELAADSGMTASYNVHDSAITLAGVPKKVGKYPVKVNVKDAAGRIATSNILYFEVFGTDEKLVDYLKIENSRKMHDGKYIWDMNPWLIKHFTHDSSQTVTLPKDIKAWYGSNTSGVYGKLGEAVEQGTQTKHNLIIPSGADLTMVNMIVNSSVRIVVKDGAKLNLKDTSIYGEIVVENGGTFSMNHETDHKGNSKFTNGAMINDQLILEDGATITNSKIYSNANFLTDGTKAKKIDTPVVVAKGNVNIVGEVYIRGDESATGEYNGKKVGGQPALKVENGNLNITSGSTLGLYGGGRMATTSIGGNAIELSNGEISGEGKLVAIGGASTWGTAGNAVSGNGKISVANAVLNGGNSYGKGSTPGKAYTEGVEISNNTIGKANDGKLLNGSSESDQPLYWNDITSVPQAADFGTEKINNTTEPVKPEEKKDSKDNIAEEKKPDTPVEKKDDSKPAVDPSKKDSADEYYFEVGANAVWKDANKDLLLVVKSKTNDAKTFDNFTGVEVDGKKLDPSNYKAVRGSVRISIRSSYLRSLSNGNHTITVSFNNGSASTSFNVANASGPVNTGDTGSLGYVFAFLIAGSIFVTIMAKKEEHNKIFID